MASDDQPLQLLELPTPCLLAVLRCCAADSPRSLLSAARAHSTLHRAAVGTLSNINIHNARQCEVDGVLLYLDKHGQHVSSIDIEGQHSSRPTIRQLSYSSLQQLTSLSLSDLRVQLLPGGLDAGVLNTAVLAAPLLKQLRLYRLTLLDGKRSLTAALAQLPALQHFVFSAAPDASAGLAVQCTGRQSLQTPVGGWYDSSDLTASIDSHSHHEVIIEPGDFPAGALQALPAAELTHLELTCCNVVNASEGNLVEWWPRDHPVGLQHLQRLTSLQDLRLSPKRNLAISARMLSGLQQLTRLELENPICPEVTVEPAVLGGRTQLQHLVLMQCRMVGGAAGVAQLLSHLQPLQQLTYLDVSGSLHEVATPAAAYSALTASTNLQHLDLSHSKLPAGVWQHMFPAGRQLPQLQVLDISTISGSSGPPAAYGSTWAPEGSRLVSCCPGLLVFRMHRVQCSAKLLAPLSGLSGLQELGMVAGTSTCSLSAPELQAVCQLSGLRRLTLPRVRDAQLLVQLSQLQHLTWLRYRATDHGDPDNGLWGAAVPQVFTSKAPADPEPVWRQVLRTPSRTRSIEAQPPWWHSTPASAQQPATADLVDSAYSPATYFWP